eukprot:TRINITY_DN93619_c0_g1_i1.p2 TRINITY_DN93619_c0_g1~~TRINITY_DN93619_c0_g1_i1.p2  ORF type:complete len:103 (+),score=11.71 TRINITY_DN93619_c0_g1_i1:527-835(+)
MKAAPYFETTHRGRQSLVLEDGIDYDSFEAAAERWAKKLGLRIVSRADGPDARVWDCERGGTKLWLAFDDWFPTLNLEPQDAAAGLEIQSIGTALGVTREKA